MTAKITRLADHEPKHRAASSSPAPLFPGDIASAALDAGFTPEFLEECGFWRLPAAMRARRRFRLHLKVVPA